MTKEWYYYAEFSPYIVTTDLRFDLLGKKSQSEFVLFFWRQQCQSRPYTVYRNSSILFANFYNISQNYIEEFFWGSFVFQKS